MSCRVAPFEFIYPALGFLFRVIQRLAELLPALGALLGSGLLMRFVDLLRSVGKVEQSVGERVGNQNLSNKDVVNPGQRCAEGNLGGDAKEAKCFLLLRRKPESSPRCYMGDFDALRVRLEELC